MERYALVSELETREDLLQVIQEIRDEIHELAASAADRGAAPPGSEYEAWEFKDLVAHLNGWRLLTAARLEAGVVGDEPATVWPNDWTEEENLDEINAWLFEQDREKSLSQVIEESDDVLNRIERAVKAMPERDLMEPGRFAWLGDYPLGLGPAVIKGTQEHQAEHHADLVEKATWR